jgi:hypothetical protein
MQSIDLLRGEANQERRGNQISLYDLGATKRWKKGFYGTARVEIALKIQKHINTKILFINLMISFLSKGKLVDAAICPSSIIFKIQSNECTYYM